MKHFETKEDMLIALNNYTTSADDDNIRFKQKIRDELMGCPALLYALHNTNYENELFDGDNINWDGEWDKYFGDNIKPYLFIPESTSESKNFLCYKVSFRETSKYNAIEKYGQITFVALCDKRDTMDETTGIARHDLIGSIIRDWFNWSNIFGTQCKLVSNEESVTDTNFITRKMVFEMVTTNSIVNNGNIINGIGR